MYSSSKYFANLTTFTSEHHKQIFNETSFVYNHSNTFSEFDATIANFAGLDPNYKISSPSEITRDVMNSTVLILSANMAYADMTWNFLCRLAKISKTFKYVVIAQDHSFYSFLQSNMIPSISGTSMHSPSSPNAANYGSAEFNAITIAKITAVRKVLELGYNVLFSDVDVAWYQNPIPFLPNDVDLVIQSNSGSKIFEISSEANTGFYFLKSNSRSLALLNDTLHRASIGPGIDDQVHFGNVLRQWRVSGKAMLIMDGQTAPWTNNSDRLFTFRILHPYRFQTGQVAGDVFSKRLAPPRDLKEQDIILVHANYMVGHASKMNFFKFHRLWNVNNAKFKRNLQLWKLKKNTRTENENSHQNISLQSALQRLKHVCIT